MLKKVKVWAEPGEKAIRGVNYATTIHRGCPHDSKDTDGRGKAAMIAAGTSY